MSSCKSDYIQERGTVAWQDVVENKRPAYRAAYRALLYRHCCFLFLFCPFPFFSFPFRYPPFLPLLFLPFSCHGGNATVYDGTYCGKSSRTGGHALDKGKSVTCTPIAGSLCAIAPQGKS